MQVDRIQALNWDAVLAAAAQLSYLDLKKLRGKVNTTTVGNADGSRFVKENAFFASAWRVEDLYKILELLNLAQPRNKIMLLQLLKRGDLIEILHLLDKSQLLFALFLLPKDRLLRLMLQ